MPDVDEKIPLARYLSEQLETAYFSGFSERLSLAWEFLNTYLSPADAEVCRFSMLDTDADKLFLRPRRETGANASIAPYSFALESLSNPTDEEEVKAVASVLFLICFGFHPFYGQKYYAEKTADPLYTEQFFSETPQFIFEVSFENPNRFVGGYHETAYAFFNQFSAPQQRFFFDAFSGKLSSLRELKEGFASVFSFLPVLAKTPCGENVNALKFDDEYIFLTADNLARRTSLPCGGCSRAFEAKCAACAFPERSRTAKFLKMNLKLFSSDWEGKHERFERELSVSDAKEITVSEIMGGEDSRAAFEILLSRKPGVNVFGARYLLDTPIAAECKNVTRAYRKNGVIALLPSTRIYLNGYILAVPDVIEEWLPLEKAENKE